MLKRIVAPMPENSQTSCNERSELIRAVFDSITDVRHLVINHLISRDHTRTLPVGQLAVLCHVGKLSSVSTSALAKMHGSSVSAITQIADELEKKGLLSRGASPGDKRVTLLQLTEKGTAAKREMQELIQKHAAAALGQLTNDELRLLRDLHRKILSGVKDKINEGDKIS